MLKVVCLLEYTSADTNLVAINEEMYEILDKQVYMY